MVKISKSNVANAAAGITICATICSVVFVPLPSEALVALSGLAGFSAKHLWDSSNN